MIVPHPAGMGPHGVGVRHGTGWVRLVTEQLTDRAPALTVVVPCFNEEPVLPETARRLRALLDGLIAAGTISDGSRVCFVDDGSRDRTWDIIQDLTCSGGPFVGLRLSRNRGHQNALMAGLLTVSGDLIVSIDADLQDDPDAITAMLRSAAEGADIVYGVRGSRDSDDAFKRVSAHLYYRTLKLLGVEIVFDHADFRLLSRRAVEALREYEETNLFLRALIPQLGFESRIVTYTRAERFAGVSKYPLRKMLTLAFEGITSFSTRPLRMVTVLGCVMSVFAMALSVWALVQTVIRHATIPGWASTVIPIYLVCGVQLLSLGVIGEYVGKIYLETKRRPRFIVAETIGSAFLAAADPPG